MGSLIWTQRCLAIILLLHFGNAAPKEDLLSRSNFGDNEEIENNRLRNPQIENGNPLEEIKSFLDSVIGKILDLKEEIVRQAIADLNLSAPDVKPQSDNRVVKHEEMEEFRRDLTWTEFDKIVSSLPKVRTGRSFNGSTLAEIQSRVSKVGFDGHYTAVVFVNHLNRSIDDFKMYDKLNVFNPAPFFIAPHTEEVFTFAEPDCCSVGTSFCYNVPSSRVRIAAISEYGTSRLGLAFVPERADMKKYYNSTQGIPGLSVYREKILQDQKYLISFRNLHARMFVSVEGEGTVTLRIELMEIL